MTIGVRAARENRALCVPQAIRAGQPSLWTDEHSGHASLRNVQESLPADELDAAASEEEVVDVEPPEVPEPEDLESVL